MSSVSCQRRHDQTRTFSAFSYKACRSSAPFGVRPRRPVLMMLPILALSPESARVLSPCVVHHQAAGGVLRQLQQFRPIDQVETQRLTARRVIRPTGNLDQSPAAKLGAVAWLRIAEVFPTFVGALCRT